jgi:DsbC/DsbD-like thiol-disulfide interchange protein
MRRIVLPLITLLAASAPVAAHAASSPWFETDGARLRLVTVAAPDAEGAVRGVLQIALEPGWKTYWKDPGDAGIPPQIDISASMNVAGADIFFPPPQRFDDGISHWAGYGASVSLPVRFRVTDPGRFTAIDADVFLGVCKEVCVPVQARLSVAPDDGFGDEAAVVAGFAALPTQASSDFGIVAMRDAGSELVAEARLPEGTDPPELFVVTPSGWGLKPPVAERDGDRTVFRIPILDRPKTTGDTVEIEYTLVVAGKSVAGTVGLR